MSCDYSLSSTWKGKSWKDWISKLNVENLLKEKDRKHHHLRKHNEIVRMLPRKDILLHRQYPKEEVSEMCLCEKCGKVMMLQSYTHHSQTRHGPAEHQTQETSKETLDNKKKSKPSKNKKKSSQTTSTPQSTPNPEQTTPNESSALCSNKGKLIIENTTLENAKKSSSSKSSGSSSHSMNKKRSKSKSDVHSLKIPDDKKSKDSSDQKEYLSRNSLECKSNSKDWDNVNSRSSDHSQSFKESVTEDRDKSHNKSEKKNSFCCEKCGKVFETQDLLSCHQKYKHSSSSTSKHNSIVHNSSNSKSSSSKKKSNSTSKSSSSTSNSKKLEKTPGTKPYTDLVADLSSLINHKGKTWSDMPNLLNNNKIQSKTKDSSDYHTVRSLPRMEIKLFGDFPKVDSRILTSCEKCNQVVIAYEIDCHQKNCQISENSPDQLSPSAESLSPNSIKKKNAHLKNRKKSFISSSSAVTPIVNSKSAPSSPPSPLQASNELSPTIMQAVQISKASSSYNMPTSSSSPTTPPSSPSHHKKLKKDNKYKVATDTNVYYDPDKQNNTVISGKGVCLRSIKSNEQPKTVTTSSQQLHLKGANNNTNLEGNHASSPPVQVVKPFIAQSQLQQASRSLSPSSLMPPPPMPSTSQIPKHKKSKKSKKSKEPAETELKHTENSDASKGPCLRSVRNNNVSKVQQRRIIINKNKEPNKVVATKVVKEKETSPPTVVVKSAPGPSVPKLLDDDADIPINSACTTTSQQAQTSQISSTKFVPSNFVKIAPVATVSSDLSLPSMPQLFTSTFTTSLDTAMTTTVPITLTTNLETTLPPNLSPTLATTLPNALSPTFTTNVGLSMPTLQPAVETTPQPSVPSILDPAVQTIPPTLQPEVQQFQTLVPPTISQPIEIQSPIQSTISTTLQQTIPTTLHQTIQTTLASIQPIQTTLPPNIQTLQPAIQTTIQPVHQSTILTTLQSSLQPAVQPTVPSNMQPIQLAIAPASMSPGDAFIPAISPSQLVLLPMSPVSVVSPIQEKGDLTPSIAPKTTIPKHMPERTNVSKPKKGNMVSILRKNNENSTIFHNNSERTIELLNSSLWNAQPNPPVGSKLHSGKMISILRKPTPQSNSVDRQSEKASTKNFTTIPKSAAIMKSTTETSVLNTQKFVQFGGPVIRMASQPFLNPEPIFLTVPVPNTNSSLYTPHPKPLNAGILNGGVLKRHGVAISPHRASARVEFLRNEIQQATITRRPIGNQCSLLNTHHHRPNILKQPRNHLRTAAMKRSATDKIGNENKQIRLASDMNGYILHTDVSEAAEAPQPTNSVTFLNLK